MAPVLAFGLPIAALVAVVAAGVDHALRLAIRRGLGVRRPSWNAVGIGNALLELHVAVEPQRARIETVLLWQDRDDDADGDDPERPDNLIRIDFVGRRRR